MGVVKILVTKEYTNAYRMCKSIAVNKHTWVRFKAHLQEAQLDREELKQIAGVAGYGIVNNVKRGEL